jgi:phospholipid transport system substrate-binding protein
VVKTVVLSQGDTFPIDYKMMNRDNNWRVYDVVIENIGLVANYRNEFSGIIRKDKFSGLMEKLRAKVK